jgi:ERCC4-type nuclease
MGKDVKIIIDSREQLPYEFGGASEAGTLDVGDYSLAGVGDAVAIERKTIDDLVGCLTKDRERFKQCLQRGKSLDYFALVLEASLSDLKDGRYWSQMHPNSAVQSLLAMSVRYRLPIFFAENRELAQLVTESLLEKYARMVRKRAKLIWEV